jgi:hypothetical protein
MNRKHLLLIMGVIGFVVAIIAWSPKAYTPMLTNTGTLNFGNTLAGASSDLTITVTGAAAGDPVVMSIPNAATSVTGCFIAWVSATNTVTVRYVNSDPLSANDPASGSFKVTVIKP